MDESSHNRPQPDAVTGRTSWSPLLHEIAFAANLACIVAYGFLWYLWESNSSWAPRNNLAYYFHRSSLKLTDLLRSGTASAVSTDMVGRESPGLAARIGDQLTILLCVVATTVLLLAMARLTAGRPYRFVIRQFAPVSALLAMPGCFAMLLWLTHRWTNVDVGISYSPLLLTTIFLAELLCIGILSIVNSRHPLRLRILGGLLVLHYLLWLKLLWPFALIYLIDRNLSYCLFFSGFIAPGFIWLFYLRRSRQNPALGNEPRRPGKPTFIMAGAATATLLFLWLPGSGSTLSHPKDMGTVRIEMSRGPCYGTCPSYTLTIHGSGAVEYSGQHYVQVHGVQTAVVSREQVMGLLKELDRIHFAGLEDRAFAWCFDTPSVAVSVSMDGKTRRVVSDASCTGAKSGPQDQFVAFTNKIDAVTGSERWVKCDGSCR